MSQFTVLEPEAVYEGTDADAQVLGSRVRIVRGGGVGSFDGLSDDLCGQADGLFVYRNTLSARDLERFSRLKVIVRMGVGYDRLDRAACAEQDVLVCNVPDYGTAEVADHAIAMAMALRRGLLLHHDVQRGSPSPPWVPLDAPVIRRIEGQTFGVVGLGRIGTAAALRAKALGFQVTFFDPLLPNGVERSLGIQRARTLPDLLRVADVLSLHCLLSPATRGLIGEAELRSLPADAIVVNTSRGPVLDVDGLHACLRDGHLAGTGLDVLPVEPPQAGDEPALLTAYRNEEPWLRGRLIITPHVAFYSREALADIRRKAAETMRDVLCDGLRTNVVAPTSA